MSPTIHKLLFISTLVAVTCAGQAGTAVAGPLSAPPDAATADTPSAELLALFPSEGLRSQSLIRPATPALVERIFGKPTPLRESLLPDPAPPYATAVYVLPESTATLYLSQFPDAESARNAETHTLGKLRSLYPEGEFREWRQSGTATSGFLGRKGEDHYLALRRSGRVLAICPDARTPDEARRLLFRVEVDEEVMVLKPNVRAFRQAPQADPAQTEQPVSLPDAVSGNAGE